MNVKKSIEFNLNYYFICLYLERYNGTTNEESKAECGFRGCTFHLKRYKRYNFSREKPVKTVLDKILQENGFSFRAVAKKWAAQKRLVPTKQGKYAGRMSISGINGYFVDLIR